MGKSRTEQTGRQIYNNMGHQSKPAGQAGTKETFETVMKALFHCYVTTTS